MNRIKNQSRMTMRFAFLLLLTLMITNIFVAQDRRQVDRVVEKLRAKLSLTEDQAMKLQEILSAAQDQLAQKRDVGGNDKHAFKATIKTTMSQAEEQIQALLSDEQKTAFAKSKKMIRGIYREKK